VAFLPELAYNVRETDEYKDVYSKVKHLAGVMVTARGRRAEDMARLTEERDHVVARVKRLRAHINDTLDRLESQTLEVLQSQYEEYASNINAHLHDVEQITENLEKMQRSMSTETEVVEDSMRFIEMRRAKKLLKQADRMAAAVSENKGLEQLQFLPDHRISDLVTSMNSLGQFASQQRRLSSFLVGEFNVHLSTDVTECQILGSDFLPDGKALLSDWENRKIKLLNTSFKVIDHLKLSGCPYSVCTVNQSEGIASLTNKKELLLFNIDSRFRLTPGRVIKTGEFCRDVHYSGGHVYVVCGRPGEDVINYVAIYRHSGDFIRSITTGSEGDALFSRPLYVSLNSVGHMFITDEDKGIVCLDEDGRVITEVTDRRLRYPNGLTVVGNDQVLVCGFGSNNVLQLGRNFMSMGEVIPETGGLRNPRSVCYDVNTHRIIVTSKNTDCIRVYSLK